MKIVNTDNYNGDYPNESFVNIPSLSKKDAEKIANIINTDKFSDRFYKIVDNDYELSPGFEP